MPTTTEVDYLDGDVTVSETEPSSIAELTELIGEQAVVDETVSNLRYRNKYPRIYRLASKELGQLVEREVKETKTLKDGTVKKVYDSEMNHLRACFKADPKLTAETITKHAQAEPLYVKGERTGGGGKVSAAALNAANGFMATGDDKVEEVASKIEELVPGYKIGRDADNAITPESLARGIQALNKHMQKQAQDKALAALA